MTETKISFANRLLRKGSFSEKDREGLLSLRNSNNDKKTQNNGLQRSPSGVILVGSTPVTPTPNDLAVTRNVHFVCPFEGIEGKKASDPIRTFFCFFFLKLVETKKTNVFFLFG